MLPEVSRFYAELGQNLKLFEKYKALRASAEYATLSRRAEEGRRQRNPRLPPVRRRTAGRPEAALPGDHGRDVAALCKILGKPARRHQRLRRDRHRRDRSLPACRTMRKQAARTAAEKAGVEGWRFSLQAPSYGPVMQYADNRELRACMYRAYATRAAEFTTAQQAGMGQRRLIMQRMLRTASRKRRRCSASTTSPRYRWCPRWPTRRRRYWPSCANWRPRPSRSRPEGYRRTARLRRRRTRPGKTSSLGCRLRFRKAAAGALRLLRTGSEAVFHRTQGAGRPVQGHREPVQRQGRARTPRRSGTRTCASTAWKRRPAIWSASSTSTSTPARPSAAAPGWTKPRARRAHRRRHPEADRLPELQFRAPGRPA